MSTPDDRPTIPRATIRGLYPGLVGIVAVSVLMGFQPESPTESIELLTLVLLLTALMVAGLHLVLPPSS